MRILVVTSLYPNPYRSNLAPFNKSQFRALVDRHPTAIISPIAWTDELAARLRGAPPLPRSRRLVRDGMVVDHPRYLHTPRVWRGLYGRYFRRSIRRAFERALVEFTPDVVLGSWAYPDGWAAVDLGHDAGLPAVVQVHGCDVLNAGRGLERDPVRKRLTVEALHRADAVLAVSRDLASKVVELGIDPRKVHVQEQGVDAELFSPGDRAESRERLGIPTVGDVLLWIGRIDPVKGLDVLIEACSELVRRRSDFRLYLVGDGSPRAELEARSRALGLSDRIHFMGARGNDQLPDWYRAADLTLLPSRSEGLPNVLRESLACGTPFVASDVGGVPEIAEGGAGRLVPAGDPTALAEQIDEALREAPDASRHRPISWGESSERLAEILQPLVKNQARSSSSAAPSAAEAIRGR
jgi:glycosyltransferase involved in cell wall biosynthesis